MYAIRSYYAIMQLQAFSQIYLKKGESKQVTFILTKDMFCLIGVDYKRVVEPGDFKVMIGSSSKDVQLEVTITLEKGFRY